MSLLQNITVLDEFSVGLLLFLRALLMFTHHKARIWEMEETFIPSPTFKQCFIKLAQEYNTDIS